MIGLGLLIDVKYYLVVSKSFGELGDYQQFDVVPDYHFPLEEGKERSFLEILPYEGIIVKYLTMKMNCMEYDENMEVEIKIPENHKKLFKSKFLLEAVNNTNTFYKLLDYMKNMEIPAIVNYYGEKYGKEVANELLKEGYNGISCYIDEDCPILSDEERSKIKPLQSYEKSEIAKYVWKTVVDLTIS